MLPEVRLALEHAADGFWGALLAATSELEAAAAACCLSRARPEVRHILAEYLAFGNVDPSVAATWEPRHVPTEVEGPPTVPFSIPQARGT